MGLEPFLIAASLETVLAQRLVRRICKNCRTAYEPDTETIQLLDADPTEISDKNFLWVKVAENVPKLATKVDLGSMK